MILSISHKLWLKQTVYTVIVVTVLLTSISAITIVISYDSKHNQQQQFSNQIIDSYSDAAARAAFHVDELQAEAVVDGLMQHNFLNRVSIITDRGEVLVNRSRSKQLLEKEFLTDWLFSDVTHFKRKLVIDRSKFLTGQQLVMKDGDLTVGEIEIYADATLISQSFIKEVKNNITILAVEFLILAVALAVMFHRTITRPLENVVKQLSAIDPKSKELANLKSPTNHELDELGMVVKSTNELLIRIGEQQVDLVHREKLAALSSMLAEVAHELNNPLAVLTTQTELLLETATDQQTIIRAEKIMRPAKRCANIVQKFLTLARRRKIEKSIVDVHQLINESIDLLSYQLIKSEIDLQVDIQSQIPKIWGDGPQLSQVLINILINAQQSFVSIHDHKNILIKIYTDSDMDDVYISIIDNGSGIPNDIRDNVFVPFFTTKPEGFGTGLGLPFCKSVIDGHDGSIELNDQQNHGTEVLIKLPATTNQPSDNSKSIKPELSLLPQRILIVDDEVSMASSISDIMFKYGHKAITANSVVRAKELIRSKSFDIILTDIHMTGSDGIELFYDVKNFDDSLSDKFIFMTGYSLEKKLKDFFNTENHIYLNKPFRISELFDAISKVVLRAKLAKLSHRDKEEPFNV